jgi:NAD(P)-dependent dehydrogenase (short-subunit alcohol dehydrogenase family)
MTKKCFQIFFGNIANYLLKYYLVLKHVYSLLKTLSNELGVYNITVNNVMPGYTETERLKELMESNPSFASAKTEIPLGRFGKRRSLLPPLHF